MGTKVCATGTQPLVATNNLFNQAGCRPSPQAVQRPIDSFVIAGGPANASPPAPVKNNFGIQIDEQSAERYPNGNLRAANLSVDQNIQGIRAKAGKRIELHQSGIVKEVTLGALQIFNLLGNVELPAGTIMRVDSHGRLTSLTPTVPVTIQGLECLAKRDIWFHQNGYLKSAFIANGQKVTIAGNKITLGAGSRVEKDKEGRLKSIELSSGQGDYTKETQEPEKMSVRDKLESEKMLTYPGLYPEFLSMRREDVKLRFQQIVGLYLLVANMAYHNRHLFSFVEDPYVLAAWQTSPDFVLKGFDDFYNTKAFDRKLVFNRKLVGDEAKTVENATLVLNDLLALTNKYIKEKKQISAADIEELRKKYLQAKQAYFPGVDMGCECYLRLLLNSGTINILAPDTIEQFRKMRCRNYDLDRLRKAIKPGESSK